MDTARVLLIDDDEPFRQGLRSTLQMAGHTVRDFARALPALACLERDTVDLVLTDLRLPDLDGLELLARSRAVDADRPVLLMTAHGDIETAVSAMRQGAFDFIEKPFGRDRLLTLLERALQQHRLLHENRQLRQGLAAGAGLAAVLVGDSAPMRTLRQLLLHVAPTPVEVLVVGETGTGKELVARALHDFSGRRGPFAAINCAALPETLMESELFGHEKGAFTGAATARVGRIEHAQGGTLFLDEIEAMPLSLQAKLLRVLQEREVQRLGANRPQAVDVRVVAASNADLAPMIASGRFRTDLFYRLDTVTLRLPALRERPGDILPLFEHFTAVAVLRFDRERPPPDLGLSERLLAHAWPGNARELKSAAERHVLGLPALGPMSAAAGAARGTLQEVLTLVEAQVIAETLARHGGQVEAASAELGLSQATLYRKLRLHGLAARPGPFTPAAERS
ncbi:MAG: sigma-54-dependent Fis family transcriptional regulator [Burkholderiales bacterium]|nr:sigma-54-dependent Fis family transcriptional regulator [Burkholderiales bacterium]